MPNTLNMPCIRPESPTTAGQNRRAIYVRSQVYTYTHAPCQDHPGREQFVSTSSAGHCRHCCYCLVLSVQSPTDRPGALRTCLTRLRCVQMLETIRHLHLQWCCVELAPAKKKEKERTVYQKESFACFHAGIMEKALTTVCLCLPAAPVCRACLPICLSVCLS